VSGATVFFFQPYLQKVLITVPLCSGTVRAAWVEYSSCEDDEWNNCEISLKLKKVD